MPLLKVSFFNPILSPMNHAQKYRFLFITCLGFLFTTAYGQPPTITEKIDSYLQKKRVKSSLPGFAVAVVRHDSVLFCKGYGMTGTQTPVTANTPFAIASLSKAFTALAVMQLVQAGRIDLNAPIVNYLPALMNDARGSTVTVRQLLNQTSGLADRGFSELSFKEQPRALDEAMLRLKSAELVHTPGEKFQYHNPNYQILAKLVEAVSREKFPDYLQKHLFQPLQMTHTWEFSHTKEWYTGDAPLSQGHGYVLGKPIAFQEPDWFVEGAAGVVSNVNDMAHWLRLQLNHGRFGTTQLLDSAHMAMMHRPPSGVSHSYGMGWFLTGDSDWYHSGILWTYSAEQIILTKEGYGIVVLFNGGLNPFVDYYSFLKGITDILKNKEPDVSVLSDGWCALGAAGILLLLMGVALRRLLRVKQWEKRYTQRPRWRSGVYLFLRLLPLVFFLLIPVMITSLSGRVLSWQRIFLMAPDVILGVGILALFHLAIVGARLAKIGSIRSQPKKQTPLEGSAHQ